MLVGLRRASLARISHQLATASANCTSSRGVLAPHSSTLRQAQGRRRVDYACVVQRYVRPDLTHTWRFRYAIW
jgi:hypothetical protein